MYKKQLTAQKLICLAALIMCAMVFIYSLGIMTDLYDTLYSTMRNPSDLTQTDVSGSIIYYDMQDFDGSLLMVSIGMILLALLLFVTHTNSRRRYYIGNYVAVALFSVAGIAVSVWAHLQIESFKAQFLQVDFEALAEHAETWGTAYTESTFWFDVHYLVFGLLLLSIAALIANVIWKCNLMKAEQNLIKQGKELAV